MKSLSRVRLLATPWTVAYQAPPSMGFFRQEYWSGVPLPSPELIVVGEIKLFSHIGDIPFDPRLPVFLLSDSLYLTESSLSSTGQPSRRKVPISLKHQEMRLHSFAILQPILQI